MPRAERFAQPRIDGQRQKTRRGGDAVFLNDHRAVMERRRGQKNALQQIVAEHRVETDAAFDVVAQADLPLDRDDRADPLLRQQRRGDGELFDRLLDLRAPGEIAEERRAAEVRERAADVRLKQHDHGEHDIAEHVPDQPVHRFEMPPA